MENNSQIISGSPKRKTPKLLWIVAIVTIAVAAGAWYVLSIQEPDVDETLSQTEQLQQRVENESDPAKKASLYNELSASQQLDGDVEAAIQSSKSAAELDETAASYAQLALMYEEQQNYEQAIDYYKRAAELSERSDNPDEYTDYNYYTGRATYLETLR